MKIFSRDRVQEEAEGAPPPVKEEPIDGDRGIPSINRARSVQSRVSSLLAITLMSTLGLGLLTWYYAKTLTRPSQVQHAAQAAAKTRAQGDMPLPPLGPIESPFARKAAPVASPPGDPTAVERMLGPAPPLPVAVGTPGMAPPGASPPTEVSPVKSAGELAFERRLAGPAFARSSNEDGGASNPSSAQSMDAGSFSAAHARAGEETGESGQALNTLLRPTVIPAVAASALTHAPVPALQGGIHRLHAGDRDRLDAPRDDDLHYGDGHFQR